ncbi:DcaP family trimeric outer membrane transporter [Sulfurimonas sp.]
MSIIKFLILPFIFVNIYASDELEIRELKNEVKNLLKRIEALEKKAATKTKLKVEKSKITQYIKDDTSGINPPIKQKGSLELKSADTVLSVGGRIQLDTHYMWPDSSHSASSIPITNTEGENGQLKFDSRYSRLWVKTRTPSIYGPVRTLIETDFLGTAGTEANTNSSGIRLRHAYVQAGNWTVGQTNSAFNTYVTLDVLYTAINDVLARQPLIRYSIEGKKISYDLSFEQPETTLLDPNGKIITPKDDVAPDLITRIRYYPTWGELGFSFMGRYINQDHAELSDGTILNNRDSALGWATNLSAKVKTDGYDDIRFALHYGIGLGRYIAYNAYSAGTVDADGNIKLQPTYGGNIGYRHWWNKKLRSTLSFSYTGTDNNREILNSSTNLDSINKEAYSSQINLLWIPLPNAIIGVEYVKAKRKVESNKEGDLDSAMLRMRYDF